LHISPFAKYERKKSRITDRESVMRASAGQTNGVASLSQNKFTNKSMLII